MSEKLRKRYKVLSLKRNSLINQLKALKLQKKNIKVRKKIKLVRSNLKVINAKLKAIEVILKKGTSKKGTFVTQKVVTSQVKDFVPSAKPEFIASENTESPFQATVPVVSPSPLPLVTSLPVTSPVAQSVEESFQEEEIYVPPSDELRIVDDLDENLQDKVMAFYEENKLMILAGVGLVGAYLIFGGKKKRSNPKRKKAKSKKRKSRKNRRRSGYHRH